MNCFHCKKPFKEACFICDNDCATQYCAACGEANILAEDGSNFLGIHDPKCGELSKEDEDIHAPPTVSPKQNGFYQIKVSRNDKSKNK